SPLGPPAVDLCPTPFAAVAAALRERKLSDKTIGIEKQFLSVNAFEKLQRALPDARFREVSPLLLELRTVKTAEEIRRLRVVTAATQNALAEAIASLQPGTSGLDIERTLGAAHYRAGVRHEWCHTQLGPLGIDVTAPHAGRAERGMAVRI